MNYEVPPPGYVPTKRASKPAKGRLTWGEAFRTTAKVASGYNKAASLQALAGIAHEVRRFIRG